MKLSLSILGGLAALGLSAQAATLTVTNVDGTTPTPIVDTGGALLGSGVYAIGTGDLAGLAANNDIAGIKTTFQQFGDAITTNLGPGIYQSTVTSTVGGSAFAGQNVYTVIGNGSSIADSTALAVWDHQFNFVAEADGNTSDSIIGRSGSAILGNTVDADLGGGAVFPGLQLVGGDMIPEPSSALLGLLGLSFLAFRRRK